MGKSWFLFAILLLLVLHLSLCVYGKELDSLSILRCKKHELDALLKFKHSFTQDPMNRLSSWVGEECCQWHGVTCDNVTHNVVKLNLRSLQRHHYDYDFMQYVIDCLPDPQVSMVSSGVSSALLELKLLTHLDLSGNNFSGSHIPEFIGSMRQLRYLNLSFAGFSGPLPPQLGNLTNLVHLDLHVSIVFTGEECNDPDALQYSEGLGWVSKLSKLQSLDLSGFNLSRAHDTFRVLKTLPSLSVLSLSFCELSNSHLSKALISNTSNTYFPTLKQLDLGFNSFNSPLPSVLKSMVSLQSLNLGNNHLNGSVPLWLKAMSRLQVLDLSENGFSYVEGGIMGIMGGNPCRFVHLDLSRNYILGDIQDSSMSLSGCDAFDLEYLDLSHNMINGSLPSSLGQFSNLNYLVLSDNEMNGSLPSSLGQLTNLNYLDLSRNEVKGHVPESFTKLSALNYLDLSRNKLSGLIPESIGHLTQIEHLDISWNYLHGRVPSSFVKFPALKFLDLSNNNLSGLTPDFIRHSRLIEHLDISSNSFQGTVYGIGNLSKLSYLDMGFNYLNINLDPNVNWLPASQLRVFRVHSCGIDTVFPQWLRNQTRIEDLDLSNIGISGELPAWLWNSTNLEELHLSDNQLTGSLPQHITCDGHYDGSQSCMLEWLDLHNNLLTGTIPQWLGRLENVEMIDLSSNQLSGPIFDGNNASLLFNNGSSFLRVLNLNDNMFSGEIHFGMEFPNTDLVILSLRGNHFNGPIPSELCDFQLLTILVLAHNRFTGHVPRCLGSLPFNSLQIQDDSLQIEEIVKGIVELITGRERDGQSILDFSSNYLVGRIPEELTNISALFALNLSYNHLTGHIPENIGNLKTVESLDLSNNHLSGTIPQSLSSIPWISKLNLSNNNLHGPIPTGSQLQTLDDPSIYAGNSGLCGFPLPDCTKPELPTSSTNVNPTPGKDDVEKKDKYEKMWFIIAVMSGVATGFWGVVGTLVIKRSWRQAYFRYLEDVADRIYVPVKVRLNKIKRRFNRNS